MESAARTAPEAWVRHTLDNVFSDRESETRRRLYVEISDLDPNLAAITAREFANEFLLAELNLFVALAPKINSQTADVVSVVKREYVSRLPAETRVMIEKADVPYSVRVRQYGIKGIWEYTAVAEMFIERLGCRPVPQLMKRVELALAVLGELWHMDALRFLSL